jgi:ABC-type antimicrobial peptide transport system permease subunit
MTRSTGGPDTTFATIRPPNVRAKGLSEARITLWHALRDAFAPVLTQFGIDLGSLLGGAIVTEVVFGPIVPKS